jgi:hypothetical protein
MTTSTRASSGRAGLALLHPACIARRSHPGTPSVNSDHVQTPRARQSFASRYCPPRSRTHDLWGFDLDLGRCRMLVRIMAILISFALVCSAAHGETTPEQYIARVGHDAKLVAAGQLQIDGLKMFCGQRPTVLDNNLNDYAASYPGFIILNPTLFSKISSTPVKQWIYAQSCGYQFHGPDTKKADCFAVQRGRRQGWLTPAGFEDVCEFIGPTTGDKERPAGPKRCQLMRECFNDPNIR